MSVNMGARLSAVGHAGNITAQSTEGTKHKLDELLSQKGGMIGIIFPFAGPALSFIHKLANISIKFLGTSIPGLFSSQSMPLQGLGIFKLPGGQGR